MPLRPCRAMAVFSGARTMDKMKDGTSCWAHDIKSYDMENGGVQVLDDGFLRPPAIQLAAGKLKSQERAFDPLLQSHWDSQTEVSESKLDKLTFSVVAVHGMSCAACVSTVRRCCEAFAGVSRCDVSLLTHTARVQFDASHVDLEQIIEAINDIGFDAEAKVDVEPGQFSSLLPVQLEGGSTRQQLDRVLEGIVGVKGTDMLHERLRITYFPAVIGARDLLLMLAGMAAHDAAPPTSPPDPSLPKQRRLILCLPAAVTVFCLAMIDHDLDLSVVTLVAFVLTSVVLYFGGWILHSQAIAACRHGSLTMDVLVSTATNILFVYASVCSLHMQIGNGITSRKFMHFFCTVAVLVEVLLLGRCIEERARQKTTATLRDLTKARPRSAMLVVPEVVQNTAGGTNESAMQREQHELHTDLIQVGDVLRLQPGECIPADGFFCSDGHLFADESLLTGEAQPVLKEQGTALTGGSVVFAGGGLMEVTAVGNTTVLAKIVHMVEHAQLSAPRVQRIADEVSAVFVPVIFVIASITLISWVLVWQISGNADIDFSFALSRSMAVLMIACPCALGLATPTAVMVATGIAARDVGCLIKSTETFESMHKARSLVLDKTGTITLGRPGVVAAEGFSDPKLWAYVAAVEATSEHPLGKALFAAASAASVSGHGEVSGWRSEPGFGVEGIVEGVCVRVGNETWSYADEVLQVWASSHQRQGCSVVFVALDGCSAGAVALQDQVHPESRMVVKYFQRQGVSVWMCTGDSEVSAAAIAEMVGIDPSQVVARATPERKALLVNELKSDAAGHHGVVMVGDGINDAPSLAAADLGIAIGCGSHLTCDAADVVLVKNSLGDLKDLDRLSRATVHTIYRNFFWAFIFNSIGIPFAAGAFYHPLGVLLPPLFAGLAMACSSITVIASSLLLFSFKTRKVSEALPKPAKADS